MSDKLLPCPFCGGEAEIAYDSDLCQVRCSGGKKCSTWPVTNWKKQKAVVIAAWNRRHVCPDHEFVCNTCDHKCEIELIKETGE